jgi:hypothetical protein
MKSTIFWDITQCSRALLATCFYAGFLLGLFRTEDGGDVSPNHRLTFNRLHNVDSTLRKLQVMQRL